MTDREIMQQALTVLKAWDAVAWRTLDTIEGLETALAQPEPQVCCGDYEKCMKPCTPRGRWLAEKELTKPEQKPVCNKDPSLCGFVQCQLGKVCKHTAQPEQDWDLLAATQDSLREHQARIKELEAQLAQPEQKPVEWDDDEWVKKAMEMSRDFVERAKARQQPPPTDTITMAELRKTDLYRKVQTQFLRDILRDDNT